MHFSTRPRRLPGVAAASPPGPSEPQDSLQASEPAPPSNPIFPPVTASPALRQAFDSLVNVGGVGTARLLDDNLAAWNARWSLVGSARSSISCQYFCWDKDIFGMSLLGHMYKKATQEQVKMRLMVDATGDTWGTRGFKSHIGGQDYLQELVMTGKAEARVYHPHWKKVLDQLRRPLSTAIAASNHDKILEVDGERGITGGRNIGYEYFVHPDDFKGAWRDTDVYFESKQAAHALRDAFDIEYGTPWITSKVRPDLLGNWVKRDLELMGAYLLMDNWLKDPPMDLASKNLLRTSTGAREAEAAAMVERALQQMPSEGIARVAGGRERRSLMKLARELAGFPELRGSANRSQPPDRDAEIKILDKTSSVGVEKDELNSALLQLSKTASRRIVIENPYVVLTDSLIEGLREAGSRGVEIWLGTNSPSSTDSAVTQAFFLEDWPKLLATIPNLKIFVATGERKLHAKVAVIDDTVSLVSTYNLDYISQHVNSEVAAVVWSEKFAADSTSAILRDHADPRNGVVEYRILRDARGQPCRSDGQPVLDARGELVGQPEVVYGPENHLTKEMLDSYKSKRARWSFLRKHVPQLASLETLKIRGRG